MPGNLDGPKQERDVVDGEQKEEAEEEEDSEKDRQIYGLLVGYKDDGIDESIHSALQNKKRVHYKCMDVMSNFVALGTSVGAIYLFRLASITHSSCSSAPNVITCDQGPVEVIKFVPGGGGGTFQAGASNNLLVVIGTARGSIVIFQLSFNEQSVLDQEIYRAEEFTRDEYESSIGIKLIEYDQDLFDPSAAFTKLYICDQRNRIFVLDQASIGPKFRLLHSHKPAPILSVTKSTIHQICVHRSQLLLSTDEKAHLFSEYSNELLTIGQRQRKTKGFFGACFYNKYYKPARLQPPAAQQNRLSQQTVYSSTASLAELDNLLIFVARPKFSVWRVNSRRDVEFTHMFKEPIREAMSACKRRPIVELHNEPLQNGQTNNNNNEELDFPRSPAQVDNYASLIEALGASAAAAAAASGNGGSGEEMPGEVASASMPKCDHFEKLMPIFSSTLGNLLLSYTRHEIYVLDPIGAQLIVCHAYERPIQQVCCNENEIFVMLELGKRQTRIERIILLAPTQFVLELHRLNRFLSLTMFIQLFKSQFKRLMALPLSGPSTITTEGGLLRNIVWNTWREMSHKLQDQTGERRIDFDGFKEIVDAIMDESRQFKQSLDNLADSRLFFTASHENLERLCSEPYASMVSLDISIANLHTNHVVHFSQEALNRHKSLAKLSQSIMNLSQLQKSSSGGAPAAGSARSSLLDLSTSGQQQRKASRELLAATVAEPVNFNDKRVIVEPLRPRINLRPMGGGDKQRQLSAGLSLNKIDEVSGPNQDDLNQQDQLTPVDERLPSPPHLGDGIAERVEEKSRVEEDDPTRCPECKWPRPRAHLKPMHHSQQIQYSWLQENLLPNFEENIEQIEERAFKHGLWRVVLRCLAFRNQLEDYVRCCLMLDDVSLLNAKRFIITRCSEDELVDLVFKQLEHKLDFLDKHQQDDNGPEKIVCLKCGHETLKRAYKKNGHSDSDSEEEEEDSLHENQDDDDDDEISFNLIGLFKILLRKSADIKRAISILLQYPSLLEKSEIPATFYLEALGLCPRPHRVGTT